MGKNRLLSRPHQGKGDGEARHLYKKGGIYFKGAEVEQSQTEAEHERLQQ